MRYALLIALAFTSLTTAYAQDADSQIRKIRGMIQDFKRDAELERTKSTPRPTTLVASESSFHFEQFTMKVDIELYNGTSQEIPQGTEYVVKTIPTLTLGEFEQKIQLNTAIPPMAFQKIQVALNLWSNPVKSTILSRLRDPHLIIQPNGIVVKPKRNYKAELLKFGYAPDQLQEILDQLAEEHSSEFAWALKNLR